MDRDPMERDHREQSPPCTETSAGWRPPRQRPRPPPPWTDKHLGIHNLRRLRLRTVIIGKSSIGEAGTTITNVTAQSRVLFVTRTDEQVQNFIPDLASESSHTIHSVALQMRQCGGDLGGYLGGNLHGDLQRQCRKCFPVGSHWP